MVTAVTLGNFRNDCWLTVVIVSGRTTLPTLLRRELELNTGFFAQKTSVTR